MRLTWIKVVGLLLAMWSVAGGVMLWAHRSKPTPESLLRYVAEHPVGSMPPADRARALERIAGQLNQLDFEQRREVRMGRKLEGVFNSLTAEEQTRFLDLTLPSGFKQMMDGLNRMEPEKRKRFVAKALEDMKKEADEEFMGRGQELDANAQKIMDQGFRSFYSDATAETKMDVAPLIEQMQKNMQGAR